MAEANGCIIDRTEKQLLPIFIMIRSDIFCRGPADTDKRNVFIMLYQGTDQHLRVVVNERLRCIDYTRYPSYMLGTNQEEVFNLKDISVPDIKKALFRVQKKIADAEQKMIQANISKAETALLEELEHAARSAGM